MGLKQVVRPLDDVFDENLDTAIAPSLGKVYGYITGVFKPETHVEATTLSLYGDPDRFFSVTYITEGMRNIFEEVLEALEKGAKGLIVLPSLFGGGKTHVLLALHHVFRKSEAILKAEPRDVAKQLYNRIKRIIDEGGVEIMVIDGDYATYAPSPSNPLNIGPYTIQSVWGYISHCLGKYDEVSSSDEKFEAPPIDKLEVLFSGQRALVLMDEILSGYTLNLSGGQRRILLEFFRRLASAVQGKRIAVVITIPAYYYVERRTAEIEVEELFKDLEVFIRGFFEAIREQAAIIPPVRLGTEAGGDIVRILRKRIFGKSDITIPGDVLAHYQGIYELEMFPYVARQMEALKESYPFHPTYIDILMRHIAERKPAVFQRTRFAIFVTRKSVRKLWRSGRNPDFIHVWSVDLEDDDISNAILGKLLTEKNYKVYLSKLYQLAGKFAQEEKVLAKDLITTIFLRTFLYEGISEAIRAYPTEGEVYWAIYDRDHNVEPARLRRVLEQLVEDPDIGFIVREESRIYFTTLIEINEIVKKRAEEVLAKEKNKVLCRLKDELQNLLIARDEFYFPFSKEYTSILTSTEIKLGIKPEDTPQHKVVVYLGSLDRTEAENLVLGYTNYRNVVVVLDVHDTSKLDELLTATARLYVIDRMDEEKELEKMFAEDKNTKRMNEIKLKDIKKKVVDTIKSLAPRTFNRIWYPAGVGVRSVIVSVPKKSLLGNIRATLESTGIEKILKPEEVDLQVFLSRLADAGGTMNEWTQVSTLIDLFYRNQKLWMADRSDIINVLKRLYENLDIMVMREGKIYWKNICRDNLHIEKCHGGPDATIADLNDLDIIARAESKFEWFVKELLNTEESSQVQGGLVERLYRLQIGSNMFRLKDLLNTWEKDKLYHVVKDHKNKLILVERFIESGFDINVEPEYTEAMVGRDLEVKVYVKPIGEFKDKVILKTDTGIVNPPEGIPRFEATWKLKVPGKEDLYEFQVEAYSGNLKRIAKLSLKVIGEYEVIDVEVPDYNPRIGDLVEEISGKLITLVLDIEEKLLSGLGTPLITLDAIWGEGKLEVKSREAELSKVKEVFRSLAHIKDVEVAQIRLKLKDAKPLDESRVKKFNAMKTFYGGIKLKVKRKVEEKCIG
jgi:hypothetical protein